MTQRLFASLYEPARLVIYLKWEVVNRAEGQK